MEGRRLSLLSWLASYRDGLPTCRQSHIQVLTGHRHRVTSLIKWNALPLRHTTNHYWTISNTPVPISSSSVHVWFCSDVAAEITGLVTAPAVVVAVDGMRCVATTATSPVTSHGNAPTDLSAFRTRPRPATMAKNTYSPRAPRVCVGRVAFVALLKNGDQPNECFLTTFLMLMPCFVFLSIWRHDWLSHPVSHYRILLVVEVLLSDWMICNIRLFVHSLFNILCSRLFVPEVLNLYALLCWHVDVRNK